MPDLFDSVQPASFKSKLQSAVQRLATSNIFIGTSSWKYSGWTGLIYDEQRYHYRGKFAETRFERDCLTEYAEVFKTVCVDAAYYQFPSAKYLTGLVQKVPDDFLFTFKCKRRLKSAAGDARKVRTLRIAGNGFGAQGSSPGCLQ